MGRTLWRAWEKIATLWKHSFALCNVPYFFPALMRIPQVYTLIHSVFIESLHHCTPRFVLDFSCAVHFSSIPNARLHLTPPHKKAHYLARAAFHRQFRTQQPGKKNLRPTKPNKSAHSFAFLHLLFFFFPLFPFP